MKNTKCSVCASEMRQIGPFSTRKLEGQPSAKWDGTLRFECKNEDCSEYNKIVQVD